MRNILSKPICHSALDAESPAKNEITGQARNGVLQKNPVNPKNLMKIVLQDKKIKIIVSSQTSLTKYNFRYANEENVFSIGGNCLCFRLLRNQTKVQ